MTWLLSPSSESRATPSRSKRIGKSVYRVSVDGNEFLVDGKKTGRTNYSLIVDNRSFEIEVDNTEDEYRVLVDGRNYRIHLVDERRVRVGAAQSGLQLQGRQMVSVPMPGKDHCGAGGERRRRRKGPGTGDRRGDENGKRGAQPDQPGKSKRSKSNPATPSKAARCS